MTIGSIEQLLRTALDGSGVVAQRLGAIKAGHPEIAWYPFNSLAKLHLLRMVTDWFDGVDAIPLRTPSQPSVLDVGTADGDLAFVFEAAGCEVTAIDNHHSNNNRCVGVNAMKGYLGSNLEFLDIDIDYDFSVERSFDFLIFLDIFYHLRNPLGALINLSRAGRYITLSTRICERAPTGDWIADVPCVSTGTLRGGA